MFKTLGVLSSLVCCGVFYYLYVQPAVCERAQERVDGCSASAVGPDSALLLPLAPRAKAPNGGGSTYPDESLPMSKHGDGSDRSSSAYGSVDSAEQHLGVATDPDRYREQAEDFHLTPMHLGAGKDSSPYLPRDFQLTPMHLGSAQLENKFALRDFELTPMILGHALDPNRIRRGPVDYSLEPEHLGIEHEPYYEREINIEP